MISHFIQFCAKLTPRGWLFIFIPFILIGIFFIIKKYVRHPVLRSVSYFVVVLAFVRCILIFNPVIWATYNKMLPLESIDWRHHDVITSRSGNT